MALGSGAITAAATATTGATINGTAYTYAGGAPIGVLSLGSAGNERQITHVAAGQLTAASTDAVNGSQLFATNTELNAVGTTVSNIVNNGAGIKYFHTNSTLADGTATGTDSLAVGPTASASGANSAAIGKGATASQSGTIAIGNGAIASATNAISIGSGNNVSGVGSGAIGDPTTITGAGSYSLGNDNTIDANNAFAIGNNIVIATGLDGAVVLGNNSTVASANATAGATINGISYTFAGGAPAAGDVLSVGGVGSERQITNVAAGQLTGTSTDAVNGSQLFATNTALGMIISGGGVKYFHANSIQADSVASGTDSVAIGGNAQASGSGAVAMGDAATASADGSVAVGAGSSDSGRGAEAYTGTYSNVSNSSVGTVSVGNAATGETRTLSNVADGREATDAVNLRQLDGAVTESKQYTDSSVQNINNTIGGSITNVDNRVTQVQGNVTNLQNGTDGMFQVNNTAVAAKPSATGTNAVAGGAGSVASGNNSAALGNNAQAAGENSVAIGHGASASGTNSTALGANSVATRDNSVSVGAVGSERQITNVAAAIQGTDAVNFDQLNRSVSNITNNSSAYTDQRFNEVKRDLQKQDDTLSAGIAGAMAMASLPQPYSAGASMTSLAAANYRGQSSLAFGVSTISKNGRWVGKLQASANTQGDPGIGIGIGYQW